MAGKNASDAYVSIIADHIIAKMPSSLMRRLINGDWRRPMREAMKLTVPFFAS
jgi:hypothetical protein